jgi:putative ABC transport system substrate-binding protein
MVESDSSSLRNAGASRTRRTLLRAISIAITAPLVCFAQQQQKVWRIGYLAARSRSTPSDPDVYYDAFVQEMRALGYIENKNLVIEWRFADGKYERLPELAAELVRLNVDVLVTHGTPGTRAAKQATTMIPIVMSAGDVIAAGLVASLARPGGNVTGLSFFQQELLSKRLELLKEAMPRLNQVGYLMNLDNSSSMGPTLRAMEIAAKTLNVGLQQFAVRGLNDFDSAFSAMTNKRIDAVAISDESIMLDYAKTIADLAVKQRILSIGGAEFPEAGGLMGYGMNLIELYRGVAHVVDKLLKGAKPGDIPVEQPKVFELVINMKTAKALGIKIPQSILVRAGKVIE